MLFVQVMYRMIDIIYSFCKVRCRRRPSSTTEAATLVQVRGNSTGCEYSSVEADKPRDRQTRNYFFHVWRAEMLQNETRWDML